MFLLLFCSYFKMSYWWDETLSQVYYNGLFEFKNANIAGEVSVLEIILRMWCTLGINTLALALNYILIFFGTGTLNREPFICWKCVIKLFFKMSFQNIGKLLLLSLPCDKLLCALLISVVHFFIFILLFICHGYITSVHSLNVFPP